MPSETTGETTQEVPEVPEVPEASGVPEPASTDLPAKPEDLTPQAPLPAGVPTLVGHPRTTTDAVSMCKLMHSAGMVECPVVALLKFVAGQSFGLDLVQSQWAFDFIQGRLTPSTELMKARISKAPDHHYEVLFHDAQKCVLKFWRFVNNRWNHLGTSTFTIEDATKAGLVRPGSGWAKYPRNYLFARAMSNGTKWFCPHLCFSDSLLAPDVPEDAPVDLKEVTIDSERDVEVEPEVEPEGE